MTITLQDSPTLGARDPSLLLSGMQQISLEHLVPALDTALRRVDDYLFDRSSAGGEGAELTALRDLRRARPQLAQRFERALIDGFRRAAGLAPSMKAGAVELSLVDEDSLEQQLADEQMIDGLTRMHAQALKRLEARLAVLLERQEITPADNPIGPASIAAAMRASVHGTDLSSSVHIALFKFYERELGTALKSVYDRANERLAAAGVLPRLDPVAPVAPVAPPAPQAQGAGWGEADDASANEAPTGADHTLFSSLVGLLQSWRTRVVGAPTAAAADVPRLRDAEMMSVLSLMQNAPPRGLDLAAGDSRQSLAEQLRSEVLANASRLGLGGGGRVHLSNQDEDALDLVGMLFDVLLDDRDFEPDVRRKIGRLLVPYVKVAVKDRRMFLYKGHPARRLLNAVAEACEGNHGDGPQERELLDRVDATIERLVTEFNEDIAIFEALEAELRAFMAQHRKRVELAEKRAAESQRGRERLEQARAEASQDLRNCRGDRQLPPALDDFVTHYVGHHLTQVILREGRESPRYGEALHAVAGLLAVYDMAELGVPLARQPALDKAVLQTIMASSGCIGDSADSALGTMQRTLEQLVVGDEASASAEQLPERPMPVEAAAPEPLLSVVAGSARLDYDDVTADRMRALQVGTWVQLTSESGRTEPAKVSWVSPISSRLLFVNRRGIRVLVASAEELAALAKLGRVQLREGENVFEDAMHQVLGRLKKEAEVAAVGIG